MKNYGKSAVTLCMKSFDVMLGTDYPCLRAVFMGYETRADTPTREFIIETI